VGNSDISNVVLEATTGFPVKGRIVIEGLSQPATFTNTTRRITLTPLIPAMPQATAQIDRDGTFVFQSVLPGDYQITSPGVLDASLGFIKSVRLGGQEMGAEGLHIRTPPDGELSIVVSMATGKIEGRILNNRREPASNATIVIVPEPSLRHRMSLFLMPRPDAAGKFTVNAMPGRYKIFAWEDVEPGAWFDADFMQNNESHGHPISIVDGNTESVEITVIPYMP